MFVPEDHNPFLCAALALLVASLLIGAVIGAALVHILLLGR